MSITGAVAYVLLNLCNFAYYNHCKFQIFYTLSFSFVLFYFRSDVYDRLKDLYKKDRYGGICCNFVRVYLLVRFLVLKISFLVFSFYVDAHKSSESTNGDSNIRCWCVMFNVGNFCYLHWFPSSSNKLNLFFQWINPRRSWKVSLEGSYSNHQIYH